MPVASINTAAMRLQVLSALVIGLTRSQPSLAVVHASSSTSAGAKSSSATKSAAPAKVATPLTVKPHHVTARAIAHVPVQRVSLKITGNAPRNPTATGTSVASGMPVQNKPAAQ